MNVIFGYQDVLEDYKSVNQIVDVLTKGVKIEAFRIKKKRNHDKIEMKVELSVFFLMNN